MLYALNDNNEIISPTPKARGYCKLCKRDLIAKCGQKRIEHWAHKVRDCDDWYEPESDWHRVWKKLLKPESVEVVKGKHIADIVGNNGTVIELQHSTIKYDDIKSREEYYRNMIWLFDGLGYWKGSRLLKIDDEFVYFKNRNRTVLTYFTKPSIIHLPDGGLFEVQSYKNNFSLAENIRYDTYNTDAILKGKFITWKEFIDKYVSDIINPAYSEPNFFSSEIRKIQLNMINKQSNKKGPMGV